MGPIIAAGSCPKLLPKTLENAVLKTTCTKTGMAAKITKIDGISGLRFFKVGILSRTRKQKSWVCPKLPHKRDVSQYSRIFLSYIPPKKGYPTLFQTHFHHFLSPAHGRIFLPVEGNCAVRDARRPWTLWQLVHGKNRMDYHDT